MNNVRTYQSIMENHDIPHSVDNSIEEIVSYLGTISINANGFVRPRSFGVDHLRYGRADVLQVVFCSNIAGSFCVSVQINATDDFIGGLSLIKISNWLRFKRYMIEGLEADILELAFGVPHWLDINRIISFLEHEVKAGVLIPYGVCIDYSKRMDFWAKDACRESCY